MTSPEPPTAGAALQAYLAEQSAVLRRLAEGVRAGEPRAVHESRIAARRTRSVLRVYRRLVHREVVEDLVEELRWYGKRLAPVRDAQVLRVRLEEQLAGLSAEQRVGQVERSVAAGMQARQDSSLRAMTRALGVRRPAALLDAMDAVAADPPLRGRAAKPARTVLPDLLHRAHQRVRAERTALRRADPADREHHWHEVRKRAKAARYGAEVLVPVVGGEAGRQANRWRRATSRLGEVQDGVVARELLLALMREAQRADEPTFTYGVLHERERAGTTHSIESGRQAVRRALRVDPRDW